MNEREIPSVILGHPIDHVHLGAGHGADGPVPAVANADVHVACVQRLEVRVQRHEILE